MLRRLQLAAVLVHNPELAFVDEPMEGLDPILRQEVWGILQGMADRGEPGDYLHYAALGAMALLGLIATARLLGRELRPT